MAINKALRQKWVDAGYDPNMGSAIVLRPPCEDLLRVYHITSAEFGISDIGLERIKVARFSDLNDPFELMAMKFGEQRMRQIIRNFKSEYDKHTGLLCFSANWTNPVLWSHYGAKHKGVCLGFNLRRKLAQEVSYEDERMLMKLDESESTLDERLQDILLRTKFRHWQYEEEFRVFVGLDNVLNEGMLYFYEFNDDLQLAEVILGPQCNLSLHAVRRLTRAQHPHAAVFKARLAFKSFAVVPDERTVPIT